MGIDVIVHSSCNGEACHIPVVVSDNNLFDWDIIQGLIKDIFNDYPIVLYKE